MGTKPSTLLSKAGIGSQCMDVCHTSWGACKSVHCCICLEHNKERHSPLGAMNRTRSFLFYPWCPARVSLDRAAMLSVWELRSCCEPGLKSVTIRILHLWVTLFSETGNFIRNRFSSLRVYISALWGVTSDFEGFVVRQRLPLLSPVFLLL